MSNKLYLVLLGTSIIITLLLFNCNSSSNVKNKNNIELLTIKLNEEQWAYQIKVNGKPYIYQKFIPAVSGVKPFLDEDDALKVGKLMVEKMKKDKGLPTITLDEIKSLNLKGL